MTNIKRKFSLAFDFTQSKMDLYCAANTDYHGEKTLESWLLFDFCCWGVVGLEVELVPSEYLGL